MFYLSWKIFFLNLNKPEAQNCLKICISREEELKGEKKPIHYQNDENKSIAWHEQSTERDFHLTQSQPTL